MKKYIEFYFYLPFFDLIDDTDGVFSLEELMRQLNITSIYHMERVSPE